MTHATPVWRIWIDTGGTFTDCVAVDPVGATHRAKVLSDGALRGTVVEALGPTRLCIAQAWGAPRDFVRGQTMTLRQADGTSVGAVIRSFDPNTGIVELDAPFSAAPASGTAFEVRFAWEAPILAARLVTGTLPGDPLPPLALRVATTRGTNALLTRQGTPPALFTTSGFGDLLEIGTQQRPELFALDILKPEPLYGAVCEVGERLSADGAVLRALDETALRDHARALRRAGVRTAVVAFLHSDLEPAHERRAGEILRAEGFTHVSESAVLAPFVKVVPRAQTAVVNAYLSPLLDAYRDGITSELPPTGATLHFMTSAGGLVGANHFAAKDSLLSGPAGGVVGAAQAALAAGFSRIIAFDMGGTSTDVARYDGEFDYVFEHRVGDALLVAPALAIESVAAGGGSICRADRHGLHVGPESAGATPGPACYGRGGPLTLTDVNLLLGRLDPARFEIPIDRGASERAADALLADLTETDASPPNRTAVLEGLVALADERMADAIRRISLRKGYDPAEYALVGFGGAGGQHACAVADRLGIKTVMIPADAGLLSAWGLGRAGIERFAERQILLPLTDVENSLPAQIAVLEAKALGAVVAEGIDAALVAVRRRIVTLRLAGQESAIALDYESGMSLAEDFRRRYRATFGDEPGPGRPLEIETIRVVAAEIRDAETAGEPPVAIDAPLDGPACVVERHCTIFVASGWTAVRHASGARLLTRGSADVAAAVSDPAVQEALFAGRFTAIAEEMGETLRRTALSTNVKERLDFSCAVLDAHGRLVANAAHIPVHLGALGRCVREVCAALTMEPDDVVVTNHPAFGGSHLPDVTVISPLFADDSRTLIGYVASRAHHAEIGGTRPGSMPPDARNLAEEGVVLSPMYLQHGEESLIEAVCTRLTGAPFPTRALPDNRADLLAAFAANRQGAAALAELARTHGTATLGRQMGALLLRAESLLRDALRAIPDGDYAAVEYLDDRAPIAVRITVAGDTATVDFAGSAPVQPGNLNATPAIVNSAVLYVLRLLVAQPLPLNEGLMRPITLLLPPGSLVNPDFDTTDPVRCPAVVGGNTEVSQRIVDALLRALGLAACSQGTMNNTLYGADTFGYYETVCGGAGATAGSPGAHAVHTHMTNTRITDVEILERRYPVRIERFARRRGSGGAGHHPGGDGVIRETVFLAPMSLSVLTQHRVEQPYGREGGQPGATGRQTVVRVTGERLELSSVDGCEVGAGDRLILETPGGGGWGGVAG
jgi:5-oxoprolinase (ATP-hydrolysing)